MILAHLRRLWGRWWILPGGLPVAYTLIVAVLGDLRIDHVAVALAACSLAYISSSSRRIYRLLLPYLVVAIAYDAVRYPRAWLVTPERVLGCDLRSLELALFPAGSDMTWPEWFMTHHVPALDLVCAVPYLAFIYVVLGYALFLHFVDPPRAGRFLWAYAVGNFLAFTCWLLIPAAPPWYLHDHGCAIHLATAPSPAALVRVDDLLGIRYFHSFYSRAASVFGAVPSMHCSYPVMGLLVAWRRTTWATRPLHIVYAVWMAFSAVYLGHHWVLDVLCGWLVAAASVAIAHQLVARLDFLQNTARQPAWQGCAS
jgi:membrane-associated phospholipid phosphatase